MKKNILFLSVLFLISSQQSTAMDSISTYKHLGFIAGASAGALISMGAPLLAHELSHAITSKVLLNDFGTIWQEKNASSKCGLLFQKCPLAFYNFPFFNHNSFAFKNNHSTADNNKLFCVYAAGTAGGYAASWALTTGMLKAFNAIKNTPIENDFLLMGAKTFCLTGAALSCLGMYNNLRQWVPHHRPINDGCYMYDRLPKEHKNYYNNYISPTAKILFAAGLCTSLKIGLS